MPARQAFDRHFFELEILRRAAPAPSPGAAWTTTNKRDRSRSGSWQCLPKRSGERQATEGEALLPVVDDAFARLTTLCNSLRNAGQVLTLRMPPTLATRWFLPLLPELRTVMPAMDVRVTTYDAWEPQFEDSDVDAAIIQGRGDWKDVEAIPLMPERLMPICTQELARKLTEPADLKHLPLLHCFPVQGWRRRVSRG